MFLWVYDQPAETETGGLFFKTAINQIFAGLYIEHLCLIGLFFLARDTENKVSALPEAILMIILVVATIFIQLTLNSGLSPLSEYLPLSMAQEMDANETRYAREMADEKNRRNFQDGNGEQFNPDNSSDTVGLTQGANDMARQESGATAMQANTPSEYYDARGELSTFIVLTVLFANHGRIQALYTLPTLWKRTRSQILIRRQCTRSRDLETGTANGVMMAMIWREGMGTETEKMAMVRWTNLQADWESMLSIILHFTDVK